MLGSFSFIWSNLLRSFCYSNLTFPNCLDFFRFVRGTFLVPGRQKAAADYLKIKIEQVEPVQSFCPV